MALLTYEPPMEGPTLLCSTPAWLVVDKPAGLLAVPGRAPEHRDSVVSRIQQAHGPVWVVHRLDMATSGLMMLARSAAMAASLGLLFERRQVHKRYRAVVDGAVAQDRGSIDLPLVCDWPRRPLQKICHETGRPSLTHYTVLERRADGTTRLELEPVTGRSHQLRLHLSAIGHPILGDEFYAHERARAASDRLMLHAQNLSLPDPGGGPALQFESPAPF